MDEFHDESFDLDDELDGDDVSAGSSEPPTLLTNGPRELPDRLNGAVLKPLLIWGLIGLIGGAVFLVVGVSLKSSTMDALSIYYNGKQTKAFAVPFSSEGEYWLEVAYRTEDGTVYVSPSVGRAEQVAAFLAPTATKKQIKTQTVQVDTTKEEYQRLQSSSNSKPPPSADFDEARAHFMKNMAVDIVYWPEEATDPVSVAWILDKSPAGYLWAFMVSGAMIVLFLMIGLLKLRGVKNRYEQGREVWAEIVGSVSYNSDSSTYTAPVSYTAAGKSFRSTAKWTDSKRPAIHEPTDRILGIVVPSKPGKFHVLNQKEIQALQAA